MKQSPLRKSAGGFLICLVVKRFWGVGKADQIVCRKVIVSAKGDEVLDFEFCAPVFDVVISLLCLFEELAHLGLREVAILSHGADAFAIIHFPTPFVLLLPL